MLARSRIVRSEPMRVAEWLLRHKLIDLAALATTSGGQVRNPLGGNLLPENDCLIQLPTRGKPINAVASFQEWDELVPPDPADWNANGPEIEVTDLGGGIYNVLIGDGANANLVHNLTIPSGKHTVSLVWRKTPDTSETGSITLWTADPSFPTEIYISNGSPPDDWQRVSATQSEGGTSTRIGFSDSGGVEFQIQNLAFRKSDYALPYSGLAAGSTRGQSSGEVDLSGLPGGGLGDEGCVIAAYVPYGWSDRPVNTGVITHSARLASSYPQHGGEDYKHLALSLSTSLNNTVVATRAAGTYNADYSASGSTATAAPGRLMIGAVQWLAGAKTQAWVDGSLVAESAANCPASPTLITDIGLGTHQGVNAVVAILASQSRLTATEHAAIAHYLGAGRYFNPKA